MQHTHKTCLRTITVFITLSVPIHEHDNILSLSCSVLNRGNYTWRFKCFFISKIRSNTAFLFSSLASWLFSSILFFWNFSPNISETLHLFSMLSQLFSKSLLFHQWFKTDYFTSYVLVSFMSIFFFFAYNTHFPSRNILNALTVKSMSNCSRKINFLSNEFMFWFFILLVVILSDRFSFFGFQDHFEPEIPGFVSLCFRLSLTSCLVCGVISKWQIKSVHCWKVLSLSSHFPKPNASP